MLAIAAFSCSKKSLSPIKFVNLKVTVSGDQITKTIKGNVYYGSIVIPIDARFTNSYVFETVVQEQAAIISNDLWTAYVNRNEVGKDLNSLISITTQ